MKKLAAFLMLFITNMAFVFSQTTPGPQTGVCIGSTEDYRVDNTAGSTYTWSVLDATNTVVGAPLLINNQGTNQISIVWNVAAGVYTLQVIEENADGCFGPAQTKSVTITPNNTIALSSAVGTNAQTVCESNAITNITYTTTGATGATFTGLPAGVTGAWAANVVTISGTPTATGAFNYTVTLTGGCGTVNATGTITINTNPVVVADSNSPVCIGDNITLFSEPDGATSYNWTGSNTYSNNVQDPIIANATATMGGVYTVTVVGANGCSGQANTTVVINPQPTTSGIFHD